MIIVLPMVICYWVCVRVSPRERVFPPWSQLLSLLPGVSGAYVRRAFYRCVLPRCDRDAWIGFGTTISHPTAEIGSAVYIGLYCSLGDVSLEDDVIISSHVSIMNGSRQHGTERIDIPIREQPGIWPRVTIGQDTWIGERAIIQADVGRHCVIGAGAVVTRAIPDYAVAVGVPARVVRYRNQTRDRAEAYGVEQGQLPIMAEDDSQRQLQITETGDGNHEGHEEHEGQV
jgi:acetyltransferase-like isoleucine patch superfamily enzyme